MRIAFAEIALCDLHFMHCLALLHADAKPIKHLSWCMVVLGGDGRVCVGPHNVRIAFSERKRFISLNFVYKPCSSAIQSPCKSPYKSAYGDMSLHMLGPDLWQVCITNCKALLLIESRRSVPKRCGFKIAF